MPAFLRALGYPAPLKPSTMQTIGAPHTMPQLLGALVWLIDLISMSGELSPQELLLANEEGDGQRRSLTYGYLIKCYKKYLSRPSLGFEKSNYSEENDTLLQLISKYYCLSTNTV
ncbi:unnamed protein product [Gongylonema pulchrum]|uniref:Kinetochore protein NDC80 n=1 Tax=Gongylonema pulchrum TaxID=637853 RepID=A0A183D7G6_9BILA|nr:unnamed protein product [Gongylonema pulchrum]